MRHAIFGCAIALSGCGILPNNPEVNPEFKIYYSQFLKDAAEHRAEVSLENLTIDFGPLEKNTLGECGPEKKITINPDTWNHMGKWDAELLIYHEMGHCVLGQDHRQNSIMSPGLSGTQYAFKKAAYLDELFFHGSSSEARRCETTQ